MRFIKLLSVCFLGALASSYAQLQFVGGAGGGLGEQQDGNRPKRFVLTPETPVEQRCISTKGSWCKDYHTQKQVAWKPAPRGSKTCPKNCNGVGNCNADTGYCECPAGWTGDDCTTPQKRPCTGTSRTCATAKDPVMGHIDKDGKDLNVLAPGNTQSRCAGICDPDIAMCWCDGPKGHVRAPAGSPPGTPPVKLGRPMSTTLCQPKTWKNGQQLQWGEQPYDHIYGPKGWCVADEPMFLCPCIIDGLDGRLCEDPVEQFCVNQCSGHGQCNLGFCKCDPGWYGHDCARKVAGQTLEPSTIPTKKWLANTVKEPPAAMDPPPAKERKRPLIYIYDLEPLYSSKLLQYRIPSSWCVHRRYKEGNVSHDMDLWVYAVDTLFHETLAQSEHRTFDPEEADFFYVPAYTSCYPFPIMGWADFPWFGPPGSGLRVNHAAMLLVETQKWIEEKFPYWKRRNGRDHIWMFTHDEGACWAPNALNTSIWLTHWGRMELNHTSATAYMGDNYNEENICPTMQPKGWLHYIKGHPCYNPEKDLIVPSFKSPVHYSESPLAGKAPKERDILFFFKGDVGKHRLKNYSRGIRQSLYKMAKEGNWKQKYNIHIGDGSDVPLPYSEALSRSKFCLVAPGDGWSARMEDATLHGCIPVIIMDNVHAVFESILDVDSFALRVKQEDIPRILDILTSIPEPKMRSMQLHLSRVWHRFRWSSAPAQYNLAKTQLDNNLKALDAFLASMRPQAAKLRTLSGEPAAAGGQRVLQAAQSSQGDAEAGIHEDARWRVEASRAEVLQSMAQVRAQLNRTGATPAVLAKLGSRGWDVNGSDMARGGRGQWQLEWDREESEKEAERLAEELSRLEEQLSLLDYEPFDEGDEEEEEVEGEGQWGAEGTFQQAGSGAGAGAGSGGRALRQLGLGGGGAGAGAGAGGQRSPAGKRFPRPFRGDPGVDDAFTTIMQWLHSKIESTR